MPRSRKMPLATAGNEFAVDLYKELFPGTAGQNLIYSPFSLYTLLGMAGMGAGGDTRVEIIKGLRLLELKDGDDNAKIGAEYKALLSGLQNDDDDESGTLTLRTANRIYCQAGFGLNPTFVNEMGEYFMAGVKQLDFSTSKKRVGAAAEINQWVDTATNHKITGIISPDSLRASTRLILVNAIYFKGRWKVPFKPQNTRKAEFQLSAGGTVPVDMMSTTQRFLYADLPELDAEAVALPYEGGRMRMVIILPRAVDGLPKIQNSLGKATLGKKSLISERFAEDDEDYDYQVHLMMPKFKIEAAIGAQDLQNAFENLGMKSMFSDEAANFDKLTEKPGAEENDLCISRILHKAFIEVTECGVEAAAVSCIVKRVATCTKPTQRRIITVLVNRPFYFQIVDCKKDDLVLFSGHCNDPTQVANE